MSDFDKKDIKVLDFIVSELLLNGYVNTDTLIEAGFIAKSKDKGLEIDLSYNPVKEFVRYMYILDQHKVCDCFNPPDGEFARANPKTLHFQKQGGFKKVYSDLKEKKKRDDLEFRKSKIDLELAEKTLKEFPRTKWFARIGLFIAVVLALKELYIWLMQLQSQ